MPTERLSDYDRQRIESELDTILSRALNNKPFILSKGAMKEFGRSLLPHEVRERWEWLEKNESRLFRCGSSWRGEFLIYSATHRYDLSVDEVGMPFDSIVVPPEHALHPAVLQWAEWYREMEESVRKAQRWTGECVYHCHSVGQIRRVFGDDILQYVPKPLARSLKHAERRSRWPLNLDQNQEEHNHLLNTLALGAISPKESAGASVQVVTVREIEKED